MADDSGAHLPDPGHRRPGGYAEGSPQPDGRGTCELDGERYPEGATMMVDGRPATCRAGRWIGEGDDPPFTPRRAAGLDEDLQG